MTRKSMVLRILDGRNAWSKEARESKEKIDAKR